MLHNESYDEILNCMAKMNGYNDAFHLENIQEDSPRRGRRYKLLLSILCKTILISQLQEKRSCVNMFYCKSEACNIFHTKNSWIYNRKYQEETKLTLYFPIETFSLSFVRRHRDLLLCGNFSHSTLWVMKKLKAVQKFVSEKDFVAGTSATGMSPLQLIYQFY